MHKILTIVLFLILAAAIHGTDANISLAGCSLSCNENEPHVHNMLGHRAQGATGKRGPMGPKGSRGLKGDQGGRGAPGQSCECPDHEELAARVAAQAQAQMQAQIDELKGQVRYAATGWIQASNNLFYKYFGERVNYETAKSRCAGFGARLVAAGMRTEALRREIKSFFPGMDRYGTWIGLDDLVRQGSYVWSDGVKSTAGNTDWHPSQPNGHNDRCGYFLSKVYNYPCSYLQQYLCELAP